MEELKHGFVLYRSFRDNYRALRTAEEKMEYIEAVMDYGLDGTYNEPSYPLNILVNQCKPSIDAAASRYQIAVENGAKGGRKSKELDMKEINALYGQLHNWEAVAKELNVSVRKLHDFRSQQRQKNSGIGKVQKVQKCTSLKEKKKYNSISEGGDAEKTPRSLPQREKNVPVSTDTHSLNGSDSNGVNLSASRGEPEISAEGGLCPPPTEADRTAATSGLEVCLELDPELAGKAPPENCEWIGPPFEDGGRIMREYHRVGSTVTGLMRVDG